MWHFIYFISKANVKGDSRLTEDEGENEVAPSNDGGTSELAAGQSLMSTVLFSLVCRAIHDGHDDGECVADHIQFQWPMAQYNDEGDKLYEDAAKLLISKLNQLGIHLVYREGQGDPPKDQKQGKTIPKD